MISQQFLYVGLEGFIEEEYDFIVGKPCKKSNPVFNKVVLGLIMGD